MNPMADVRIGLVGEVSVVVSPTMTAASEGNDDVQVLSTSQLLRLMEQATGPAIFPVLPAGYGIVGIETHLRHLAGAPVGTRVTARAEIVEMEGNRVRFRIEAFDEAEKVGEADHRVAVVELARLRKHWESKFQSSPCSSPRSGEEHGED